MSESPIRPYLFFHGRCDEALAFYKESLGAEIDMVMRFNESPEPLPEGWIPPGFENKVMHASFQIGASTILASDGCGENGSLEGFHLSLDVDDEAEALRVFGALAEGGTVKMPLGRTFWTPCFGMLEDRFGVGWMISIPTEKP